MRLARLSAALIAGATLAQADGAALIVDTDPVTGRRAETAPMALLARGFQDQALDTLVSRAGTPDEMRSALGAFIAAIDDETDRAAVVLHGRFVNDGSGAYLLPAGGGDPAFAQVATQALPLGPMLAVLAQFPGQAVLVLSESEETETEGRFLSGGAGALAIPQGVTVLRGPEDDIDRFLTALAQPGTELIAAARDAGLTVDGFAPRTLVLLDSPPPVAISPVTPVPGTASDDALWAQVSARDQEQGYRDYLAAFPSGKHAEQARTALAAIAADPFRDARLAEEAMALNREARQQIQRSLSLLGFDTRGIDGIFGKGTRGAISAWQKQNGFDATGFVDPEQVTRLDAQAERRAAELEQEAAARRAERERLDRAYWEETGAKGDEAGLRAYLKKYPDGLFAEVAQERVAVFDEERAAKAAAQDRQAWDAAVAADTVEGYNAYLAAQPNGAFADQARARIEQLTEAARPDPAIARAEAEEAALNLNVLTRRLAEARLDQLKLKPGEVDGTFDERTRRAIRRFQEARQLPVTGYLDQATVVRLLADGILR
ncbi:MAG: peptidoglycan-binding protein [Roseivivax sp.]|nr:peptidoglycan-binding protein [Roseivivax sp.]